MPKGSFDSAEALGRLGELVRMTAPPAGQEEICTQGLVHTARTLGASAGLLVLKDASGGTLRTAATFGEEQPPELLSAGERSLLAGEIVEETAGGRSPVRVAVPLPGDVGPVGALVLERPAAWTLDARHYTLSAARTLAASLRAAGMIVEIRRQAELLARRNVELDTLWELAGRLPALESEEGMLQAALDLVLERLGLSSGWIFWGQASEGSLGLAACRGVADEFVRQARTEGIGTCLCLDVFATGRLRYARNTIECPRLPDLVRGTGPMSHACIPLKFERGVLGVMNIANRPGQIFTPPELHFLETLSHQLCLAVDKARTARAEMQRNAEARALVSLARSIGGRLEEDRVLSEIGGYARELLRAERCCIFLGDGSAPLLFAHLSGAPLPGIEEGRPSDLEALGARTLLEAVRQRRTLVIEDASSDPRTNPDLARRWGVGSLIIVPLVAHGQLEGLLVANRPLPSSWTPGELELADALGAQAAVALENARLYREAREALLKLQQAQYGMLRAERMAAVGTLAASLAHEVRNPLNSIHLQLVLIGRRLEHLDATARQEIAPLVETTRREIKRLDDLVEEFLSLSTIDRLSVAPGSPNEVVRDVLTLIGPVVEQKGIRLAVDLAPEAPSLPLDREKLEQALINLVRNALEAMPEGGLLAVTTRAGPDATAIEVTDTGVGIDPDLDVFDFFTTTKRGGTGLGLPIARRIVEAHGGSLTYSSTPGRGTTFTVTLPLAGSVSRPV